MSGMIEPYYCTLKNGQRFSHTVFLCPNVACIEACTMGEYYEEGLYNYYTDIPHIDYYEKNYNNLSPDWPYPYHAPPPTPPPPPEEPPE